MREPGPVMTMAFPRPGRTLKAVMATLAVFSVAGAIVHNWLPGGAEGPALLRWLQSDLGKLGTRPWTLVTSGLLTNPNALTHILFSLLGLFFFGPDLEKRMGGPRLVRFLLLSVVAGNLVAFLVHLLPVGHLIFHKGYFVPLYGPGAALAATTIAWSRENTTSQVRLFFFLPVSGRMLFWITIGFCVLGLAYYHDVPEGAFAPFGGVAAGMAFAGSPSPMRALYLRIKLAFLRRRGGTLTVESITGGDRPRAPKRSGKSPPLRVVMGGLDDDLKNRKPPKDKRFLN
ncbi:MAG: rhomboid family intramembrane serine protease [Labilithrix sp.]|nr:rhomboid family intramembrane serine protease [Labilithrix sp.]